MSRKQKETITCPKCKQESEFIIWKSLNADINPEAKQNLLDGSLFNFECSNCGHKCNVDYGILYHDMKKQVMVYYVNESSVEKTKEMMADTKKLKGMEEYRNRIVTNQNALREKAIIFDNDLDDRIIEIIKLIYFANAHEQFPDANVTEIYFSVDEGKYFLDLIADSPMSTQIPDNVYDDIKKEFSERLNEDDSDETIIDMMWAANFIKDFAE